ncbi:hypothetical protein [Segatella copri]|uniref:hypothetical protein n=1 Tax=Segatella copri TaxID=165179 RepID=UPI0012913294|nr:hypothetical protein [Segatella copri]
MCVGQGAWEEELLYSTRQMDSLLKEKNAQPGLTTGYMMLTMTGLGGASRLFISCSIF